MYLAKLFLKNVLMISSGLQVAYELNQEDSKLVVFDVLLHIALQVGLVFVNKVTKKKIDINLRNCYLG